jgi:hypothetical protein
MAERSPAPKSAITRAESSIVRWTRDGNERGHRVAFPLGPAQERLD